MPQDARERLIETAARLFHERSYRNVGVAEICREAEVTKGSLYHFFASKEELAVAVIKHRWARIEEFLIKPTLGGPGSARERLGAFFAQVGAACAAQQAEQGKLLGCPLGNLASELSTTDEVLQGHLKEALDAFRGHFEALIRTGVESGEVSSERDPAQLAMGLVALFEGSMVLSKTYNDASLVSTGLEAQALTLLGL